MDRGFIDAFEIKFKSAFRNLKSAILLGALLLALRRSSRSGAGQGLSCGGYTPRGCDLHGD